jgi:hypothetical protein
MAMRMTASWWCLWGGGVAGWRWDQADSSVGEKWRR